jgi:diguanylate cyclase (GGDEF)-like protein/putative nucleotidyltransferase with HDIG domain/PAS domain S-box-containing protein
VIITLGEHELHWAAAGAHPGEKIEIPIFKGKTRWGSLQICFEPLTPGLLDRWAPRAVWLGLGIAVVSFFVSRFYLRRILQHLDPSSVIPDRVRSTLDTLAEGVLVVDKAQRIVLANKSFSSTVGRTPAELQGKRASEFPWFDSNEAAPLPWKFAIDEGTSKTGTLLSLMTKAEDRRTFVVNATPILGADGKGRGALATFDDVTSIEEKNKQLENMLEALRASRDEVRRQNHELEILANNDSLTGCLNRRALFGELEKLCSAAAANREPMSCIMVDIDHFKSINDRYGHAMGDRVLQMVAMTLRSNLGPAHVVGRYGGEEFAVLLPATSPAEASQMAETLRTRVETVRYADRPVTASFGVASNVDRALEPAELINLADQALYFAKSNGRNRVISWPQVPPGRQGTDDGKTTSRNSPAARLDAPIPYHSVTALCAALSFRDPLTAEHSRRVADLALLLARGRLSERDCYVLEVAALLHDIGKLGVPEAVLLKPGPLTEDEWKVMGGHENIGVEILHAAFSSPELTAIVANQHAWFAGAESSKLPSGEDIPLGARILAIADAYDAMTSDRAYRKGRTQAEAIEELRRCAGRQFDPSLVERFAELLRCQPHVDRSTATATPAALRLGHQLELLTAALEEKNYPQLAHLAAQLSVIARAEGPTQAVGLATQLEQAALHEPDMHELVALTTQLLQLCESRQTRCLKELQATGEA